MAAKGEETAACTALPGRHSDASSSNAGRVTWDTDILRSPLTPKIFGYWFSNVGALIGFHTIWLAPFGWTKLRAVSIKKTRRKS
jgi:hypothetical protein